METDDPAQLDHVMAHLAGGDLAFAITLANGWHAPIARLVRTLLREMGRSDLARDREEVEGHVIDACFVIGAEVARSFGHRCVELDDGQYDGCPPAPVDMVDYDELVERNPRFASFDDVLRECTSERDRRIVVEHLQQQAAGDPSPSHTVGQMFDLAPATARQGISRAMRKVRRT